MKRISAAFFAGLLFAFGLGLSGMTKPSKVLRFLNIIGDWDPSLMLVMGGAIAVYGPSYYFIRRRRRPLFDEQFHVPPSRSIDKSLLLGALVFGLGWGLGGYCPGPAIVSSAGAQLGALVFLVTMVIGMRLVPMKKH